MRFDNVRIAAVAHVDAAQRVTSADLERRLGPVVKKLGIPTGMLESLTGIVARRMWPAAVKPSDAAVEAAELALSRAGVDRERLGALVNTSVCRDYLEPSTACLAHGKLGLPERCLNFDVANACLGFLNGMDLVGNMIERGQIDFGIVVDGENSRPVVDATIARLLQGPTDHARFRAEFATLTLGSGGAAMILAHKDYAPEHARERRYVGGTTLAATQHRDLCRGTAEQMITDTRGLLIAGLEIAERTFARAQDVLGWESAEDLDECVLHQVSRTHTEQVTARLGVSMDKVLATYPELGNVGPAGVPIALSKAVEAGRVKAGDRVGLMGIGSGLNCAMAEVVW
jgi:3-oxoacyl-[acyl-carrier-protein] synthase-3